MQFYGVLYNLIDAIPIRFKSFKNSSKSFYIPKKRLNLKSEHLKFLNPAAGMNKKNILGGSARLLHGSFIAYPPWSNAYIQPR